MKNQALEENYLKAKELYNQKQYEQAVEILKDCADNGHVEAQCLLADCYLNGKGVKADMTLSKQYIEQALKSKEAYAFCKYAVWTFKTGKPRTRGQSFGPTGIAVDPEGKTTVLIGPQHPYKYDADAYRLAPGLRKAVKLLKKASRMGFCEASLLLNTCYCEGYGVRPNFDKAERFVEKAIGQANKEEQADIGAMYLVGRGVHRNVQFAYELLSEVSDVPQAQYYLGECYESGKGVEKDVDQAIAWYTKALENGYEDAKKALEFIKK